MSLQSYGLLKCKVVGGKPERDYNKPHYNIHVRADDEQYRVTINIKSDGFPSELLFYTNNDFNHPITAKLSALTYGFTTNQDILMDYIRGDLGFDRADMKTMPHDRVGPNNDANEKLDYYINQAIALKETDMYVFGSKWVADNYNDQDRIFGFKPSIGVHDVHMNQGNLGRWKKDNGVWQDGCILFHIPSKNQWIGVFLAFQSQSWHTDDQTGHAKNLQVI